MTTMEVLLRGVRTHLQKRLDTGAVYCNDIRLTLVREVETEYDMYARAYRFLAIFDQDCQITVQVAAGEVEFALHRETAVNQVVQSVTENILSYTSAPNNPSWANDASLQQHKVMPCVLVRRIWL